MCWCNTMQRRDMVISGDGVGVEMTRRLHRSIPIQCFARLEGQAAGFKELSRG